jgi:ABC-2 type transport system ATP-binding protein/heme exporter protein A
MALISIEHLYKSFGNFSVLKDINLEVERGDFLTIFGPNGAGKTTLMKILSTLISPTMGRVVVDGFDVRENPLEVRRRIGVISHETYLYHELTAVENLRFYGHMYDVEDLEKRIREVILQVGLKYRENDRVGTFSRGMKQRLAIARAIIHSPEILLLDEPYTGLDQHASAIFDDIMQQLDAKHTTQIMISHDIERGLKLCNRALILNNGSFVHNVARDEIKSLEEYRSTYEHLVTGE